MHASISLVLPGLPPGLLRGILEPSDGQVRAEARRREGAERTAHEPPLRADSDRRRAEACGEGDACTEDVRGRSSPTSTASLSYQRSERTSLFLTTREGDTVELKIRTGGSTELALSQQTNGETLLSELALRTTNATRISLSVEGDLNAEELAAIRGVIDQVGALAQDFFDGGLPDAFAAAEALAVDATQLASVGLRMSVREQLTYTQRGTLQALAPAAVAPSPQAATPVSAPAAPAATVAPDPAEAIPAAVTAAPATEAANTDPAAAATPTATVAPATTANALEIVRGFLTNLMARLGAPAPGVTEQSSAQVEVSLKLRMFQSMVMAAAEATPTPAATPTPLPALVPETLDALAARQEPPLHATA